MKIHQIKINQLLRFIAYFTVFVFLTGCKNEDKPLYWLINLETPEIPLISESFPDEDTENVNPGDQIYVVFSTEMDHEITQNSFTVSGSSAIDGHFSWDENRLNYNLEDDLPPGNYFTLKVSQTAESSEGKKLQYDYIVNFTSGPSIFHPSVLSSIPEDGTEEYSLDGNIEIHFSHSMNQAATQSAFSISPDTPGTFSWAEDSTIMIFSPSSPMESSIDYTFEISTDAEDTDGIQLLSSFSSTFYSGEDHSGPTISGIYESGNPTPLYNNFTGFYKESAFTVIFNEEVDINSAESAITLVKKSNNLYVACNYTWNSNYTALTCEPNEALVPESEYRISISETLKDLIGNRLENAYYLDFSVSNVNGASNSEYLEIISISKIDPSPIEVLISGVSTVNYPTTGASSTGIGNVQISIQFSDTIDLGTFPENVYFNKVLGLNAGSGGIEGMELASTTKTNDTLLIYLYNIGFNYYLLEILGGIDGISSVNTSDEVAKYLENDHLYYIRFE